MKINEQDFQHLKDKKEIVAILKTLDRLKQGESPHPYFERLMILISQYLATDIVPVLYPYLVAFAGKSNDFAFLNFAVNIKIGFYHRADLNKLSDFHLKQYLGGLYQLRQGITLVPPKEGTELPEEFKSIYLWNAMMLYSFSPDLLVLSRNGRFDSPFKVKCPHCGNDIHSLCIDGGNMENTSNITPAPIPEKQEEILFFDDIYGTFWQVFHNFQEQHFSKILPYVYGTYNCTVCNQTNSVMEAMKEAQFAVETHFAPTEEFAQRISDIATDKETTHNLEKWMLTTFAVGLLRQLHGLDSQLAMLLPVKRSRVMDGLMGDDSKTCLLAQAEKLAEVEGKDKVAHRELLYWIALSLDDMERAEDVEKIARYYKMVLDSTVEEFGEDSSEVWQVKVVSGYFDSRHTTGERLKPLLDLYEALDLEKYPQWAERLEAYLQETYEELGDFKQSISYKMKQNQHDIKEYGEESDIAADNYRELGRLYFLLADQSQSTEDFNSATEQFQRAFEINIGELGKEYLLPPLLRNIAHGTKKLTKKAKEQEELGSRVRSASESLLDMGDIAFRLEQYSDALKQYEKSLQLWDWVTETPFVECGYRHYKIALAHEKLGDLKLSLKSCEQGIKIFEIREQQSPSDFERVMATDYLVEARALLQRLKTK